MKSLFGKSRSKSKAPEITKNDINDISGSATVNPTIQTLGQMKSTIENLTKRQKLLETKIKNELSKAIELKKQNKTQAALLCLKKKKMYEEENNKLSGSIFNLEHQSIMLESSQTTKDVVQTQAEFSAVMKTIQSKVQADDVAALQDDIQEQMGIQLEVNELLGETGNDVEDYELENELDALLKEDEDMAEEELNRMMAEIQENEVSNDSTNIALPDAPSGVISFDNTEQQQQQQQNAEEDADYAELEKLAAEMAM